MRVLVAGLGSVGRRHLANLNSLGAVDHVAVLRRSSSRAEKIEAECDRVFFSLEEALEFRPDAALITGPASSHVQVARALAQAGAHLFIEKPLSNDLVGVDELLTVCRQQGLTMMVGYNLRFCRPIEICRQALIDGRIGRPLFLRAEVGQFLPDWRPGTDYRQSVSARAELGGGAVLELSHELDYARWLMGEIKTVQAQLAQVSDLEMDVEDTAEIVLQFENKALGSIHLDMIQQTPTRNCRIVGTKGTLIGDWMSNRVTVFEKATNTWSELHPAVNIDRNESYLAELRHFFDCIKGERSPLTNGEDGKRVLEIALAAKQSSLEARVIEL